MSKLYCNLMFFVAGLHLPVECELAFSKAACYLDWVCEDVQKCVDSQPQSLCCSPNTQDNLEWYLVSVVSQCPRTPALTALSDETVRVSKHLQVT